MMKSWILMLRVVAAIVSLSLVAACANPALQPVEAANPQPYRLGAGDRIRVTTYGEQPLTGEYAVDGAGSIQFPLLGDISVAGKTTSELRDELTARFGSEFLRKPRVAVEVASYRPLYVLGAVMKPGEVQFVEQMTAFAVIAKAGGFTYRANRKFVFIRRENEATEKAYPFVPNLMVHPGDQLRVTEAIF